jgi:ComF family protein
MSAIAAQTLAGEGPADATGGAGPFAQKALDRRVAWRAGVRHVARLRADGLQRLHAGARALGDALLGAVLSPPCACCGSVLEQPTRGPVCSGCWGGIRCFVPPLCLQCGTPLPSWRASDLAAGRCVRCRRAPGLVDAARAAGPYEGVLRDVLHAFKYEQRISLAGPLARLMAAHGAELTAGADLAVPVPLHPSRERKRGFNQAWELARHLGLPTCRALRRTRRTAAQVGLSATERRRNVRNAFGIRLNWSERWTAGTRGGPLDRLNGACVLLVDDVATTGATLEACAAALAAAGARRVLALTVARALT